MQIELEIMEILAGGGNTESKAESICNIMAWDKNKLTAAITKYGTYSKGGRVAILDVFWGDVSLKNKS